MGGLLGFTSLGLLLVLGLQTGHVLEFENQDLKYIPSTATYQSKSFTGVSYQFHGNGDTWNLYKLQFFWKGKQELTEHRWHPNGVKWQEIEFQNGQKHGQDRAWYQTGDVLSLKHYVHGESRGEFWSWHSNGVLAEYQYFIEGKQVIYKSFISDGKPFYNYVFKDKRRIGFQGGSYCKSKKVSKL